MIKIRSNIFETNSSSTHSLSIYHKENNNDEENIIPRNSTIIATSNLYNSYNDKISSPMGKLNGLIEYIANYYDEYKYCNNKNRYLYGEEVLFFVLLKNLILNEYHSELIYELDDYSCYYDNDETDYDFSEFGIVDKNDYDDIYAKFLKFLQDDTIVLKHNVEEY